MKTGHNLWTTMLIMVPPEDENRTQSLDRYAHHGTPEGMKTGHDLFNTMLIMVPPEDEKQDTIF